MDSRTPWTDKECCVVDEFGTGSRKMISADFARTLERELAAVEKESEGRRATLMIVREQQISDWKRAEAAEARAREAELVLLSVAQDDCPRPVLDDPSIRACIEGGKCGCYWETCNIMKAALARGEHGREK